MPMSGMHLSDKTREGLALLKPRVLDGSIGALIQHGFDRSNIQASFFYEALDSKGMRKLHQDVEAVIKASGVKYELAWEFDDIAHSGTIMDKAFDAAEDAADTQNWSLYAAILIKNSDPACVPTLVLKSSFYNTSKKDPEAYAPGVKDSLEALSSAEIPLMFFDNYNGKVRSR